MILYCESLATTILYYAFVVRNQSWKHVLNTYVVCDGCGRNSALVNIDVDHSDDSKIFSEIASDGELAKGG
jgi:hypothetical protein